MKAKASRVTLSNQQRRNVLPFVALLLALGGMTAIISSFAGDARANVQGQVVNEDARRDLPIALDGQVLAHAQVGDRIFVGGNFQQVQLGDGSIIDQPNIYAYDINTGELDQAFRPLLNGEVSALEANATNDGLYVGGRFFRWEADGTRSFPLRIAKLGVDGSLDRSFAARSSAVVQSLEQVGGDLYVGGDFRSMNNQPIQGLARVDSETGVLDTSFDLALGDSLFGSQLVRRVVASPDGSELFVLHYANEVAGESRRAVFKLDLTQAVPVLSGWEIPWAEQTNRRLCWADLRDMAISPDGSFIVIGGQGADNPVNCDSVLRYETAGDGVVSFTWSARMYSSVFSLAVSDVAVYAGGHFCAAPLQGAIYTGGVAPFEGAVTSDFTNTANGCDVNDVESLRNPNVRDPENAVFRNGLAALDPATAQALPWDPTSANQLGVLDLTLIDRGLLAGSDGPRFSNFEVGRSGFFDFGVPEDTEAPVLVVAQPAAGVVTDSLTTIEGTVTDNRGVGVVRIRLRNLTTGQWLQVDGTFGASEADLPVTLTETGLGEITWSVPVSNLPPGDYEVRGFATDTAGTTSGPLAHPFVVPGATECSVALNDNNQPVISFSEFNGEDRVFLQRDGNFLVGQDAPSGAFTDSNAAPGDHTYVVRWRPGGVVQDIACSPTTITVPTVAPPPVELACTVSLDANGDPSLAWNDVGLDRYVVRESGNFVSTQFGTEFTHTDQAPGDYSYSLRIRPPGQPLVDLDCTPSPITVSADAPAPIVNTCTASVDGNGEVTLSWSAIDGVDTYIVRDNDGFVRNAGDSLSFIDTNPESGARVYVIRSRLAGAVTNVSCNPVSVP